MQTSKLFALFGNPVRQSLSPFMHAMTYRRMGLPAAYEAFCVQNIKEAIEIIKICSIAGASVTIPYKQEFMPYLDEIDECARRIGAVNTINIHGEKLKGYNTDWIGCIAALKEFIAITDKTFIIAGAGGAARAAVFGILKEGGKVIITNRTLQHGANLAREFNCDFRPLSELRAVAADCLINTTPAGMFPYTDAMPVQKDILAKIPFVMDMIYNPLETKLLKEARKAGCRTLSGLAMFIHQGAEQIKLWTGIEPPRKYMHTIVEEKLKQDAAD